MAHCTPVGMGDMAHCTPWVWEVPGVYATLGMGMGGTWCICHPGYMEGYTTRVYIHLYTPWVYPSSSTPCSCTPLPSGPTSGLWRSPGLNIENNMVKECRRASLGPKGVTVVRQLCAVLLAVPGRIN